MGRSRRLCLEGGVREQRETRDDMYRAGGGKRIQRVPWVLDVVVREGELRQARWPLPKYSAASFCNVIMVPIL